MAEIRCPMCGKPNPDHLEVCQHCQARLKPLVSPPGSASDSGLPDWLRDMGAEEEISPSEDEASEWLARLQDEEDQGESEPAMPAAPADQTDSAPEAEEDDWLGQIRSLDEEDEETEPPPAQAATPSQPEDHPPDWLDQLGEKGDYEEGEDDLDTLESRVETPDDEQGDQLPDWLSDMGETEEAETGIPESRVEPPSGDEEKETPDWIREMGQADEQAEAERGESRIETPVSGEEALPNWLSDFDEEEEARPGDQAQADDDLPRWASTPDEDVSPEQVPSPTPEASPAFEKVEPSAEEDEGLPDWLSSTAEDTPSEPATVSDEPSIPETESDDEALDWDDPIGNQHEEVEQSLDLYDDIPDWLSGEEDEEEGLSDLDEEPDWLQSIGTDAPADLIPADEHHSISPFEEDALEDEIFDTNDLSNLFEADGEPSPEDDADDSDLAPSDLPDWLQAMRPVDTGEEGEPADSASRGVAVNTGPLAGLRGVLLAEPEIAKIKKPPTFSAKLEVTREQKLHLKILEDILSAEGKAAPVAAEAAPTSQHFLRWIIGLFLFLVIALAVIGGGSDATVSQSAVPNEVRDAYTHIESLAPAAPVMISFDYEPGMAGEMETVASGPIDHLMAKQAHLTLVSTSPTGPALASHLIGRFKDTYSYTSGNQFVNLGYVPGGASGLLGFAKIPQRVTPLSYDGMNAWATTPLANVNTLADFALVIVITDTPNTARAWIEQVQPRLEGVPFILVASAQAEPILRPYYGSGDAQVQGLISGIPGGAAYEQALSKPALANSYQNTLGFGLMTAILAIALGGAINIIMSISKQNNPEEQGESA